ncbi:MAG: hypothetical protein LUG60_08920 [Erysipelotrichaceae bacterium]|nr:hypothetical protein [Erysipelotrichaceae bacterium]
MKIKKRLDIALYNFINTFEYYPDYPSKVGFNQIEYAKELEKCVIDNFDYTIEKYGTIPSRKLGLATIIYD